MPVLAMVSEAHVLLTMSTVALTRCLFTEMEAGTAFESVAFGYEPKKLPHTLPCRKIVKRNVAHCTLCLYNVKYYYHILTDSPSIHSP